ncbi:hypothetical protein MKEN_00828600 [Mycena kentingensis (nom. inval.)]|nr:hypothetical protein MKEN_00828600 [Mycena kentingensis (nom. inval.)]
MSSSGSLRPSPSVRTAEQVQAPSVITAPPWARDEPPSPTDEFSDVDGARDSRHSLASTRFSRNDDNRWFPFTTRPRGGSNAATLPDPTLEKDKRTVSFKERSIAWLPSPRDGVPSFPRRNRHPTRTSTLNRNWDLSITLPAPPNATFTMQHNATPGWDAPWTSRVGAQGPAGRHRSASGSMDEAEDSPVDSEKERTQKRRRRLRAFILNNAYVPLIFRLINIAFTTAALALAVTIRRLERRIHTMGELGSSPTLVIIFAPLTLVHVMSSIYLEYFGRPLGLWRTSHKLAHTLSEVLFICAWSAALSLSFDNYFTSPIPCASEGAISWYSTIPRPTSGGDPVSDDKRCDDQVALIVLVGIGLLAYCTNLVISLYRIFEKVKYHPHPPRSGIWRR